MLVDLKRTKSKLRARKGVLVKFHGGWLLFVRLCLVFARYEAKAGIWLTAIQFRIKGRAFLLSPPNTPSNSDFPYTRLAPPLAASGPRSKFDWEAERQRIFQKMSPPLKASFLRPIPVSCAHSLWLIQSQNRRNFTGHTFERYGCRLSPTTSRAKRWTERRAEESFRELLPYCYWTFRSWFVRLSDQYLTIKITDLAGVHRADLGKLPNERRVYKKLDSWAEIEVAP